MMVVEAHDAEPQVNVFVVEILKERNAQKRGTGQ